jgi:hypothetical protein
MSTNGAALKQHSSVMSATAQKSSGASQRTTTRGAAMNWDRFSEERDDIGYLDRRAERAQELADVRQ